MREESLFAEALAIADASERAAFLGRACGDDAELRREVELLLSAHESSNVLDRPAVGAQTGPHLPAPLQECAGRVIGKYKLVEQIGEGGMGAVWMAQQTEPVKRLVAVKLIKAGMDSRQIVARFEAERQALALMDHPNIARVLDAGATEAGQPYFVMELVKGVPITRYCDEHHLTPRQRLELFVPVCQAVQHAHQKGVIHRDLKPSNVLVALYDGRPVPKVIDFGIAKAAGQSLTEKTLVTGFGAIVGTLEYMSPEQAELNNHDIDTRSDVYSLGVLLYELLTGSTPFTRKEAVGGLLEMLRLIREQEPTRPSTKISTSEGLPALAANRGTKPAKLAKLVRGELDWIVMKALEKERNRRYETANAFALDVQRDLADEPVQACPPSAGYRLRKSVRRHKAAVTVTGVVLFFLVLLGVGVGWVTGDRAARRGRTAEAVAALLDQCDEALRDERADRAKLALEAADRRAADGITEGLASRLARCQADVRLLRELDDVDTFRWTSSQGRLPAGRDRAARWRASLAAYGVTPDEGPVANAVERVNASLLRDRVLTALDDWLESDASTGVRAVLREADPDPYRDAVRDAVADGEDQAVADLAARPEALAQPVRFAVVLGQLKGVPEERRRAILQAALRNRPGDLGLLLFTAGSYPIRPEWVGERLRWLQAAVAAHPGSMAARNNLGLTLATKGDLDGAIVELREAVRLDPNNTYPRTNLGHVLVAKKDPDGAIVEYQEAIRLDPNYAPAHAGLGTTLKRKGDLVGAIASIREAARLDPKNGNTRNSLAVALRDVGDAGGAVAEYQEAIRLDPNHELAHGNLAWLLASGPDSVRDGKRAVEHATRACELTGWKRPNSLAALGVAWAEAGDFAKAAEYQQKALSFPEYEERYGHEAREMLRLYAQKKPYRNPNLVPRKVIPLRESKP